MDRASLPKGRRGCAGDYCRRCATGHLRVCVSRPPTGMTVESPGQGWCHTMRNVPDPGKKKEKQLLSHNRSTGACQKKIRQLLLGASTALTIFGLSIDSLRPPSARLSVQSVCLYVCLPVGKILVARLPSNTGGAAHSSLSACPKHAQHRRVPRRRPGNIPREASFSGLPGSEAAHRQDLGLDARPRTPYLLRFLRTYTVALRFVRHGCMCN